MSLVDHLINEIFAIKRHTAFQEILGGVLTPKKTKKNQKKPSQFTNFGVATGFFWFFLGFFGFFWFFLVFFWYFLVFFGFFWDDIPTIKSNAKKNQKIPKKTKKNQKKPKKPKNQFPISNVGQSLSQKKPKKNQKNPKKPKKKPVSNFEFWPKPMPKKPKKTKKNQCQFGNFKKPKKTKKNQKKPMPICQFWCSDWVFLVFFG